MDAVARGKRDRNVGGDRSHIVVDRGAVPADLAQPLNARILDDCPPDVALLPQPGLPEDFARHGRLKALDATTAALVKKNYPAQWRRMATVDGKPYGVWLKAANKSSIWYSRRLFAKAGIEQPPRTLDELEEVTATLRARRIKPFAVAGKDAGRSPTGLRTCTSGPPAQAPTASSRAEI